MKVLAFVSQKGGTGKSTLCRSVAIAAMEAEHSVFVLDLDPQKTTLDWSEERQRALPEVDAVRPDQLETALATLTRQSIDYVFLDTAGRDDAGTAIAIRQADYCIVPCRPTPDDLRAVRPTVATIYRAEKPCGFVLNQTPPGRRSTRVQEALTGLGAVNRVCPTPIVTRMDHQDASSLGQGVSEYAPTSPAAEEIRKLWRWVQGEIGGVRHAKAA
ncbi:MAG: ParA family protein [Alphaproteobacteria bacterium GM202ARS2]|nr:ParA family protein [Alphaproteobacteria bacterium GM202ARS2]